MSLSSEYIKFAQLSFNTETNKLIIHITKTNDTTFSLEIPEPKDSLFNTMINLVKMSISSINSNKEQYSEDQLFESELTQEQYIQALQINEFSNIQWETTSSMNDTQRDVDSITVKSLNDYTVNESSQHFY
ncbi:hypothetical protein PBI_SCTP2_200 [Salicola phage SCTP-2]|nr:hypothetical protein PBI_SCTP2_200 [Salicola phage SCTP-2]